MRTRKGIEPKDADGLIILDVEEGPLAGWLLFRRAMSHGDWLSLKLVSAKPRPGAANYWLGWNKKENRFAATHDVGRMKMYLPDLLAAVDSRLRRYRPERTNALVPGEWNPVHDPADAAGALAEYRAAHAGELDALLK